MRRSVTRGVSGRGLALALASSVSVWSYDCEEAAERLGPVVPSPLGFILTAPHVPSSMTFCVR